MTENDNTKPVEPTTEVPPTTEPTPAVAEPSTPAVEPVAEPTTPVAEPTTPVAPVAPIVEAAPVVPTAPVEPVVTAPVEPVVAPVVEPVVSAEPVVPTQKITQTHEEFVAMKQELADIKSTLSEIKTQTIPVVPTAEPTPTPASKPSLKYEDLTQAQQADLLVYSETFVDDDGNRVAPDMVLKDDEGKAHFVDDEEF